MNITLNLDIFKIKVSVTPNDWGFGKHLSGANQWRDCHADGIIHSN